MQERCMTQKVEDVPGRKVIVSAGIGQTNPTDIEWLMDTVLKHAKVWQASGWAYIADCTQMKPIGPMESSVLVKMTKAFVEAGCKAFGFAEGSSVMLKIQAKKNTQMSDTGIPEGHFVTVEDALDWLKKEVGI